MIHGFRRRRDVRSGFVLWLLVLAALAGPAAAQPSPAAAARRPGSPAQQADTFVCPMHSDVQSKIPGTCPVCGMALVSRIPSAPSAYNLEITTSPAPVVPGRPFELQVTVRDSGTKDVVKAFTEVHEKRYHMFVISQDLEHYDHIHPEQQPDGSWRIDVTVPKPGLYKIYSDFLPRGGTPQVIARSLGTAGVAGEHGTETRLTPDRELSHIADSMSVTLRLPPGGLVAGREQNLTYRITDAATGAPVTDIKPYLGAWGHSLLISEDTRHVVHAHPSEHVREGPGAKGGGPELTFKATLPEPGNYRIWTQIKRGVEVSTAVFTVAVAPTPIR